MSVEVLPDGVYLGLPFETYIAQPERLGTSDLILLDQQGPGWKWREKDDDEQTDERLEGEALHALMLESLAAYESRFATQPEPSDYRGLVTTGKQAETILRDAGVDLRGRDPPVSKWGKDDWYACLREEIPDRPIWSDILQDFTATLNGTRKALTAAQDRKLRLMYDAALTDDAINELLGMTAPYPHLAEVSFLFTDDRGVKRRNRYDLLTPKFTIDLKSLGNWQGRRLTSAIDPLVRQRGWHIQLADEHSSRKRMHHLIRDTGGACILGGTEEQRTWLQAIATRDLKWDWAWLVYQKPDPKGRAPILMPVIDEWKSAYHVNGHRRTYRAISLYLDFMERFGPDRPWVQVLEPHYTTEPYEPRVFVDHFVEEAPVPGEEDAFA